MSRSCFRRRLGIHPVDCRHAPKSRDGADTLVLSDAELLQWLARWGHTNRLECANGQPLQFHGQIAALTPHLENGDKELSFTHRFALPGGENHSVAA
jgi:hypothetical protein